MVTTPYTHALGDYILEFIGLKSWTGDYSGTHLTIFYFGTLFLIGLFLVRKYAIGALNMRSRNVFIIFVAIMIIFASFTGITARIIKKYSSGLLAIGYNSKDSSLNYRSDAKGFVEFAAEFELTNYSLEKKTFHITIDDFSYREDGTDVINIYTFDGEWATFELDSKETKFFSLSLDNYNVIGGIGNQYRSGDGVISALILRDDTGNKVKLEDKKFFGLELGR
jgi:hypothetical protein